MRRLMLLGALLGGLLAPEVARAAPEAQLWLEAGVRYKPVKKVWLSFSQHLRWDNDLSRLRKIMPELEARYRPYKFLRVGTGYRFIVEGDGQGAFTTAHRGWVQATPRYEMKPVTFSYRARLQLTSGAAGSGDPMEPVLRQRVGVDVDTDTDLSPFVDAELYLQLGGGFTGLSKWRITVGAAYALGEHDFELYYRVRRPIGDPNPDTWHILGLGYRYSL